MSDIQTSKAIVLEYIDALESAPAGKASAAIKRFTGPDYRFRGVHPFNELSNVEEVAKAVWEPLRATLTPKQRRQDIFFAGPNLIDSTMWVTSMGKFMGLFDHDWLGIPSL